MSPTAFVPRPRRGNHSIFDPAAYADAPATDGFICTRCSAVLPVREPHIGCAATVAEISPLVKPETKNPKS